MGRLLAGLGVIVAVLSALGPGFTSGPAAYTLAERELAAIAAGAATCYIQTYPVCLSSLNDCVGCTTAGVACPGSTYLQQVMSNFPEAAPFNPGGWSSFQDQGSVFCRRKHTCQTCIPSGGGIVCPISATGMLVWLPGHRKSIATGTVCAY
jgi:hypothetical protein